MENNQDVPMPFAQKPKKPKERFLILSILAIIFGCLAILFSSLNIFSFAFEIAVMIFGIAGLTLGIITFILNIENRKIFSLIGFGLGIMGFLMAFVMLLLGLFLVNPGALGSHASKNGGSNTAAASSSTSNNSDNSTDNSQGPTTGKAFGWTYSSFIQLKLGGYITGEGGDNYDEVVKKHGKPTSTQSAKVNGTAMKMLFYNVDDPSNVTGGIDMRSVTLTFLKQSDGAYLLSSAIELNLGTKSTDIAGNISPFKLSDFNKLVVGDSTFGMGGANLKDVVKKYGPPSSVNFEIVASEPTAKVSWGPPSQGGSSVTLSFIQQPNGDLLLWSKQQQGLQ